jgi:hypothetical protein
MGLRGPQPKEDHLLRKHRVTCRLTDEEAAQIDLGRPDDITRSEWIRRLALDREIPPKVPEINRAVWTELSRLAGNLNQLSKRLNSGPVNAEIRNVASLLAETRAAIIGLGGDHDRKN